MAAAEQWDYKVFKATAASQLPEHGFIEVTYCLGAEPNPDPNPGPCDIQPQGGPGDLGKPDLMSAETEAKPTVAATTKSQSTSPGGKGATSDKADSKDSTAEALQDQGKTNGEILGDPRTKEYAEHCVSGQTQYNQRDEEEKIQ